MKTYFEKVLIKEYKYWDIQMHGNQSYLGRCIIWFKRDGIVDLFDITKEERDELWEIANNLKKVLIKLFKPDHFNHTALGNTTPHLHIHIIPRYKDKRVFENFEFVDEKFGKNPYPYDKGFELDEKIFNKIRDTIKDAL